MKEFTDDDGNRGAVREPIDFSCKHDILIHHKDGTFTPMDEPYYEVTQINDDTWQIMSSGDYHYVLAGDGEAIAIDTGYGAGNLRAFLEELVGMPVRWCINTHSHFDHSANNCYFDLVYMAEEGVARAAIPYPSFDGIVFPRDYEVQVVGDNGIIPLKGRELETFRIGDHTEDGIAILDRKDRILFVGDEIMPGGKRLKQPMQKLHDDMAKLMEHRAEYDCLYGGSGRMDADMVEIFYEASEKALAGERSPLDEHAGDKSSAEDISGAPEGVKVYDCQRPHPEDRPHGFAGNGKKQECLEWRGCRFIF